VPGKKDEMNTLNLHEGLSEATKEALVSAANLVAAHSDHEIETMKVRDHNLIQQLEADGTALRQENEQLRQTLTRVQYAGQFFKAELDACDIAFVALKSSSVLYGKSEGRR
jgi:hypothetical protein